MNLNIKNKFDNVYAKNHDKISISELESFASQLNSCGYVFRVKRLHNSVFLEYEKPTLRDLFKRIKAKFTKPSLELRDYQKYLYCS